MARFILDASAVLALVQAEPGADRVAKALEEGDCVISSVNLSEAMAKLVLRGIPAGLAESILRGIPVRPVSCDERIAFLAGRFVSFGKSLGLSLGDRICLATAWTQGGVALTTEKAWGNVHEDGLVIEVIR